MKYLTLLCIALLLSACGDDDPESADPLDCNWQSDRLASDAPPELPMGQAGDLADALVGQWQHTYIISPDDMIDALGDGSDIRFMITRERLNFCQHITGAVEVGPSGNESAYELEGDTIDLGATTYTAVTWNDEVMVWNNDRVEGEQYVLQRRN